MKIYFTQFRCSSSFYINKPVDLEKIHKKDFQTISDSKLDESFQWFVTYKNLKEDFVSGMEVAL